MQGNQIVARIKSAAAARGVPLETLYAACKVSSSAVSQWKSGLTNPSVASIQRIADYLDVSPAFLLYGTEDASGLKLPTVHVPEKKAKGLVLKKTETPVTETDDGEMDEMLQTLRERPDMRMLFNVTKKSTPEQVMNLATFLKGLEPHDDD